MSLTINGVTAQEYVHDYAESIDGRGPSSTKGYVVAWADRYRFSNLMLGLSSAVNVGKAITFSSPQPHPESPNMWAHSVRIQGKGRPTQGTAQLQFVQAIVWVEFGFPGYVLNAGMDSSGFLGLDPSTRFLYAQQELDYGGEWMTIPGSGLKFNNANSDPIKKDAGVFIAHTVLSITWYRVPYIPAALSRTNAGSLNSATFLGCAAGKLRYDGARSRLAQQSDGTLAAEVSMRFTYRDIARWDYDYNPKTGLWEQVVQRNGANAGTPILPLVDLSVLIPGGYTY